jgi:1,4-dihydroxy-6-naphthoate synthase
MTIDSRQLLRIGHSPDPDDAFMWWPLLEVDGAPPRLDTGPFRFEAVLEDIESLNRRSATADLEITAMSCAQYPFVRDRYAITACGASVGDAYGPKLVARAPGRPEDVCDAGTVVAVPGTRTTAFATLSLMLGPGRFRYEVVEFDRIIEAVASGQHEAGLVIHEGQLTFAEAGLHLLADVGSWWTGRHGCPLPLGLNTIRRDLEQQHGPGALSRITGLLQQSVEYALAHRAESVDYALRFARDMGADLADEFIGLYVNRWTLHFGDGGRAAVQQFLGALHEAGLAPEPGPVDLVEPPEPLVR